VYCQRRIDLADRTQGIAEIAGVPPAEMGCNTVAVSVDLLAFDLVEDGHIPQRLVAITLGQLQNGEDVEHIRRYTLPALIAQLEPLVGSAIHHLARDLD